MEGELCSYSCPVRADERSLTEQRSAEVAQGQTGSVFALYKLALSDSSPELVSFGRSLTSGDRERKNTTPSRSIACSARSLEKPVVKRSWPPDNGYYLRADEQLSLVPFARHDQRACR